MRLVTFADNTGERIGVFIPEIEKVIDLVAADPSLPRDMNAFIDLRSEGLKKPPPRAKPHRKMPK